VQLCVFYRVAASVFTNTLNWLAIRVASTRETQKNIIKFYLVYAQQYSVYSVLLYPVCTMEGAR